MPAWLPAALTAGGSLLGGLFARSEASKANAWTEYHNARRVQTLAADAKKAGVHPLAAIAGGLPSYQAAVPQTGSYVSDALQGAASGVKDAQNRRDTKEARRLSNKLTQAEIDLIEAQRKTLERQAEGETRGSGPPRTDTASNSVAPVSILSPVRLPDGSTINLLNPQAMPGDPEEVAALLGQLGFSEDGINQVVSALGRVPGRPYPPTPGRKPSQRSGPPQRRGGPGQRHTDKDGVVWYWSGQRNRWLRVSPNTGSGFETTSP